MKSSSRQPSPRSLLQEQPPHEDTAPLPVALLQAARRIVQNNMVHFSRYGSSLTSTISSIVHFFYFPEETILYQDVITRSIFSMYYLPVMAIVIAITHSFAQNVVHALIIPVIRVIEDEADVAVSLSKPTDELSEVLTALWLQLLPYGVLTMCVVAFSHKLLNCLGEAMVDAFSTHDGKDYPLLATRLRFVLESRKRIITFAVILVSTSLVSLSIFATNFFVVWTAREKQVLVASWTIVSLCGLFIAWTAVWRFGYVSSKKGFSSGDGGCGMIRGNNNHGHHQSTWRRQEEEGSSLSSSSSLSKTTTMMITPKDSDAKHYGYYFTGFWWRTSIHRIRFLAVEMLTVFCVYWIVTVGPLDTISFAVESLMYLNIPHIFGFFVLYVTTATTRIIQSYKWMARHPEYASPVMLMAAPYFSLQLYAIFYFGAYVPTMGVIGLSMVFLWARAIDLARECDVNPDRGGRVMWRERVSRAVLPLYYAAVLEDAYERKKNEPAVVSIEKTADLKNMRMYRRGGSPVDIERIVREATTTTPASSPPSSSFTETSSSSSSSATALISSSKGYGGNKMRMHAHTQQPQMQDPSAALPKASSVKRRDNTEGDRTNDSKPSSSSPPSSPCSPSSVTTPVETRALLRYGIPRLLLLQSAGTFGGRRFTNARIALRAFTGTLMLLFLLLVMGVILQASVPALRPLPMRIYFPTSSSSSSTTMVVDHLLVLLRIETMKDTSTTSNHNPEEDILGRKVMVDSEQTLDGKEEEEEGSTTMGANAPHVGGEGDSPHQQHQYSSEQVAANTAFRWVRGGEGEQQQDMDISSSQETQQSDNQPFSSSSSPSYRRQQQKDKMSSPQPFHDSYPGLCTKTFGGNGSGDVGVWELAWISLVPYLSTDTDIVQMLQFLNKYMDTDWDLQPRYGSRSISSHEDGKGGASDDDDDEMMGDDTNILSPENKKNHDDIVLVDDESSPMKKRNQQQRRRRRHQLTEWRGYVELYSAKRNVSVVGVRGTDLTAFIDMLQDVNMFFEAGLYQVLSNIVPGTSLLPSSLVTDFIKVVTMVQEFATPEVRTWRKLGMGRFTDFEREHTSSTSSSSTVFSSQPRNTNDADDDDGSLGDCSTTRDYYISVYNHVKSLLDGGGGGGEGKEDRRGSNEEEEGGVREKKRRRRNEGGRQHFPANVILTGHSLGGSITHIVGAKLGLQSVAFSSPGIVLSHKKFGVSLESIHRHTFTVISSHDIVPHIGWQGGELHHVECRARTRELCHAMEFMIGSLWHNCKSIQALYPKIKSVM